MKLENQVCTLEQAKRLKALGIEQGNSYFNWYEVSNGDDEGDFDKEGVEWHPVLCTYDRDQDAAVAVLAIDPDLTTSDGEFCSYKEPASAFTVAELGVMLPDDLCITRSGAGYSAFWEPTDGDDVERISFRGQEYFTTEAECMATVLIDMIGMGVTTVAEVNKRLTDG